MGDLFQEVKYVYDKIGRQVGVDVATTSSLNFCTNTSNYPAAKAGILNFDPRQLSNGGEALLWALKNTYKGTVADKLPIEIIFITREDVLHCSQIINFRGDSGEEQLLELDSLISRLPSACRQSFLLLYLNW